MFSAEEIVIYGTQGVCCIREIRTMKFGTVSGEYYILAPVSDPKAVIYVPTAKPDLVAKMRPVLSRKELFGLIAQISAESIEWIENDNERKLYCDRVIKSSDRAEIIRMAQMLYLHREALKDQKKHFHNVDAQYLKAAERMLHDEFAYVLGISPQDVPAYIQSHMNE